jgi:hypothetical protein
MPNDDLSCWELRNTLTIDQISLLCAGIDPTDLSVADVACNQNQYPAWKIAVAMQGAIEIAVKDNILPVIERGKYACKRKLADDPHDSWTEYSDPEESLIKDDDLKKWLSSKGKHPDFFFQKSMENNASISSSSGTNNQHTRKGILSKKNALAKNEFSKKFTQFSILVTELERLSGDSRSDTYSWLINMIIENGIDLVYHSHPFGNNLNMEQPGYSRDVGRELNYCISNSRLDFSQVVHVASNTDIGEDEFLKTTWLDLFFHKKDAQNMLDQLSSGLDLDSFKEKPEQDINFKDRSESKVNVDDSQETTSLSLDTNKYPLPLQVAIQAFEKFRAKNTDGKRITNKNIIDWIATKFPEISGSQATEICRIINPETIKRGGREKKISK